MVVNNKTDGPILAKVGIRENESATKPINMHWPRTGIAGELEEKETAVLAFLYKI